MITRMRFGNVTAMAMLALVGGSLTSGCGVMSTHRTVFPFAAIGNEGQGILLDDVRNIIDNDEMSDDEKRQALRDELGIRDEKLIEALLRL